MANVAMIVLAGATPLMVSGVMTMSHGVDEPPVTVPVEVTQTAMKSARVVISSEGTVPLPAGVVAYAAPYATLTRFAASAKALVMPCRLLAGAPIAVAEV